MHASSSPRTYLGSHRSSPMTLFTRVRVLVLAVVILAAGFAALAPHTANEVSAAGNCSVGSTVKYAVSTTTRTPYIWGRGDASCLSDFEEQQLTVRLYANGILVRTAQYGTIGKYVAVNTTTAWAYCAVRYQVSVTHTVAKWGRHETTTTWSSPIIFPCY